MPIQINELIIRAEVTEKTIRQQNTTPVNGNAEIQKIIDEFSKIIKNKNER
ncbi:MAG TPA: DUF5908 family protein [Bacteroidales bacterium]|nr:DUF5908 family protein [Bacteroidales bacterium]HQH19152.1 DUF5908 family protein [Bacteroidales bacterium]HQI45800.1 DUF5908 family protein [Bacteroidales bacterium]